MNGGRVGHQKREQREAPDRFYAQTRFIRSDRVCFLKSERMLPLRTFSFWMLVLLQQRLSSSVRHRTGGGPASVAPRGRFNTSDHMRCTWTASDAGDSVTLGVRCQNAEARFGGGGHADLLRCAYRGRPQSCPAFFSNPRGFWRQVGRALKKLRAQMCRDERALVRAGMCRRAPRDAHFRLDESGELLTNYTQTLAPGPTPRPTSTSCTGRAHHQSTAEEYCGGAWASMCSFLLSMLQTDPC